MTVIIGGNTLTAAVPHRRQSKVRSRPVKVHSCDGQTKKKVETKHKRVPSWKFEDKKKTSDIVNFRSIKEGE